MQIGQAKYGMQTLNQSLLENFLKKNITMEEALGHTSEMDELKTMILNAGASTGSQTPGTAAATKPERK
jgi:twitching motility protein PilT